MFDLLERRFFWFEFDEQLEFAIFTRIEQLADVGELALQGAQLARVCSKRSVERRTRLSRS